MIPSHDLNEAASLGTVHVYEITFMSGDCRTDRPEAPTCSKKARPA